MCIVDAQSVKNTNGARDKAYEAGKKVAGLKRLIFVDSPALPPTIAVTTANITDHLGALETIARNLTGLSRLLRC
ncbi:transposase (fragment) [Candidatus Methylobacter favarea]|uniref:Transposase n=1 Tax=Candidatus Methylobacter favarea TaxID=2707345 RepID=A0A8S0XVP6_9GAMM